MLNLKMKVMKTKKIFLLTTVFLLSLAFSETQAKKRHVTNKSSKSVSINRHHHSTVVRVSNRSQYRSYHVLPKTSVIIRHKGVNFHYYNGNYYQRNGDRYVRVVSPIGLRIRVLPNDFRRFIFNRRAYYMYNGVYYLEAHRGRNIYYEVVQAPVGAVIYELPWDAERVRINGITYFESNLVIYKKIRTSQGRAYKVVGHIDQYGY